MNKLLDLRFVIGAFFLVLGILLTGYSFTLEAGNPQLINRWCGLAFIVFGIIMIVLSFQKDANDELMEKGS